MYVIETDYAIAFLLTYRSFTTPMELLEKLIARYNIEPKESLTGPELALFEKKKKIIQLRYLSVQLQIKTRIYEVLESEM
jgi:hypothetical protein